MATTTLTQVYAANRTKFDRKLLVRALPFLAHDRFAQVRGIETRKGDQIKFRQVGALAVNTTALTEGVTPTGKQASITDSTATLAQYGDFIEYSDMVQWTNEIDAIKEFAEILGEQAGQSIDQVLRDIYIAGTTVQYTNGAARTAVNTVLSTAALGKLLRTLSNNNARMFTNIIKASEAVGTLPVRAAFWAITHPDVIYDLETTIGETNGWQPVHKYSNAVQAAPGERGAYKNLRFIETTNAKKYAGGGAAGGASVKETGGVADVYTILAFAQDGVGVVPLAVGGNYKGRNNDYDGNVKLIFKDITSGGPSNPLELSGTVGWKASLTGKILNENFLGRIECAVSV